MYLDALDHLAHDAVVVLRFVGAAFCNDVLDLLQPRLPGTVLVDALLNCCDAAVELLDLVGDIKAYAEQELDDPEAYLGSDGIQRMQPVLVSYNKAYAPKPASPELEFRIVGRVL